MSMFRSNAALTLPCLLSLACASCAVAGATKPDAKRKPARPAVVVEMSPGVPIARDDRAQAVVRVDAFEGERSLVAVPYIYGYPLFVEQGGLQGIRKLRQENWEGYERTQSEDEDGIVRVTETFPSLGCRFEGIAESEDRYVPLMLECDVPPPESLGGAERPVVGSVRAGAEPKSVLEDPGIGRAFLGEWHATTPNFDGDSGAGYFSTPGGLLGFGFERGKLTRVSFLFDPPVRDWRRAELWVAP